MKNKPKSRKSTKTNVELTHSSMLKLRHFRLVHPKHTGKKVEHRHTSYVGLTVILAIVGLVLQSTQSVWALPPAISHNVTVNAHVAAPPPTEGAVITSPLDGANYTDQSLVDIGGTCADDTTVVVTDNGSVVGSANCDNNAFTMTIQLSEGKNVLSAKNYDIDNQAGPDTPDVIVTLKITSPTTPPSSGVPSSSPEMTLPLPADTTKDNPYGLDQANGNPPCDQQNPTVVSVGGKPRVSIACLPRLFKAGVTYSVGFWTYGGVPPYAVDIDWGDGTTPHTLVSIASQQYKVVTIKYTKAGAYVIKINMRDSDGSAAYVQAGATVIGGPSPVAIVGDIVSHVRWFETPVPFYLLAVALTLGFWGGDLFDHYFGVPRGRGKIRKKTA
jgi:hypothetical protein